MCKIIDESMPYIRSFVNIQERIKAKEERSKQHHDKEVQKAHQ